MMKALDAIRPGEILLKEFMEPNSISPQKIAASLDLPIDRMTDILQGSQSITEEIAAELGLFLKMDPQFWRNLQIDYDWRVHTSLAAKHL